VNLTFPLVFNLNTTSRLEYSTVEPDIEIRIKIYDPAEFFTLNFKDVVDNDDEFDVEFVGGSRHPIERMKNTNTEWIFERNQNVGIYMAANNTTYSYPTCSIEKTFTNNLSLYSSVSSPTNLHSIFMEIIADAYFDNPLATDPIINDAQIAQFVNELLDDVIYVWDYEGNTNSLRTPLLAKRSILEQFIDGDPANNPQTQYEGDVATFYFETNDTVDFLVKFENNVSQTNETLEVDNINQNLPIETLSTDGDVNDFIITNTGSIVSAGEEGVRLWDTDVLITTNNAKSIAYDPQQDVVYYSSENTVYQYIGGSTEVLTLSDAVITNIIFEPSTSVLVVAQRNGMIRVMFENQEKFSFDSTHGEGELIISIDEAATTIVSGSNVDDNLIFWNLNDGTFQKIITFAHFGGVSSLQLTDIFLISGGKDSKIRVWDLGSSSPSLVLSIENTGNIQSLDHKLSGDGDLVILSGDGVGVVKQWGKNGNLISTYQSSNDPIYSCKFFDDDTIVATTIGNIYRYEESANQNQNFDSFSTNVKLIFEMM